MKSSKGAAGMLEPDGKIERYDRTVPPSIGGSDKNCSTTSRRPILDGTAALLRQV